MSVVVQIGPECVPGGIPGCGAEASGTAALGSGVAVDGLAGNTSPASGDSEGSFQSSWHQLIEALGLRSNENPGKGKPVEVASAPSFEKPAPGGVIRLSTRASGSKHKDGETLVAPREAPGIRTDFRAGKKAAGAGFKAATQAHESRKGDELNKASAAAGIDPASGSGFQLIGVSTPDVAAFRGDLSPTHAGVHGESSASETPGELEGRLATSVADREAMAKGSSMGPTSDGAGSIPVNGPADEPDGELPNGKGSDGSMSGGLELDVTASAVNQAGQKPDQDLKPSQDLNDSLPAVRPVHAATEPAITNVAAANSTDSQLTPAASLPAGRRSALRGGRAVEPSLARGAERPAHTRLSGEPAGEREFSGTAAQDAAGPLLVRDPVGIGEARGTHGGWGDTARAAGNDANGLTGEETFARLDAEGAARSIHWVQAGAHRAEAGYLDPNLGWVGVRAESTGGGVHAALLPGSAEAAQALGTHLSGLNAFLSEQHGPHATATMAAPEDGRYGAGANLGNSAGGGSGRDDGAGRNMAPTGRGSDSSPGSTASAAGAVGRSIGSEGSAIRRAGTYVSVMA